MHLDVDLTTLFWSPDRIACIMNNRDGYGLMFIILSCHLGQLRRKRRVHSAVTRRLDSSILV